MDAPIWEFDECLERLTRAHGETHLTDDLDPEAERRLCAMAQRETGVPAVFVVGFPASGRPFYSAPRGSHGAAQSFDLLFRGVEITTGGQRLHRRADLEAALRARQIDPVAFRKPSEDVRTRNAAARRSGDWPRAADGSSAGTVERARRGALSTGSGSTDTLRIAL